MRDSVFIGRGKNNHCLLSKMANRHGLIAGATGTGKTVTLRVLAEGLSELGVPTFLADVKGDLSGICKAGTQNERVQARVSQLELKEFTYQPFPVVFWDVFGEQGHPVRATISEMGPLLLSRLLNLNETQSGVLAAVFKIADDNGFLLLDLKDLKAMLSDAAEHAKDYQTEYGNISAASIGAIQRSLLELQQQGAERFFGEPALNLSDLIQTDINGKGVVNILAADKLLLAPKVYATFLLWLLAELFEQLPEVGDITKPKLVFFFDEAHLLFDDAPKPLLDKIETVVRLIRSKGVGVYFATQNALDIPEDVLGQLGNRIQHALRAFTPKDQNAVRVTAETFRTSNANELEKTITELGVGEAVVSFLDEKGTPSVAERALIAPPKSRLEPLSAEERKELIRSSIIFGHYEETIDRESAFEKLKARTSTAAATKASTPADSQPAAHSGYQRQGVIEAFVTSAARSVGRQIGQQLLRGILGSISGGSRKR